MSPTISTKHMEKDMRSITENLKASLLFSTLDFVMVLL
jgi:hypothetical protein